MRKAENISTLRGKPKAVCLLCVIVLAVIIVLSFASCELFTTDIYLKDFKMDIVLNEDGSMTVTETAKAYFTAQDTEWYNFYRIIDDDRAIDHPVIDGEAFMLDGRSIPIESENDGLLDLDSHSSDHWRDKYKSRAVGYYCLRQSGLEIGVVMPSFEKGTHTFSYKYTLRNVFTSVKDATVFYYKFVSEINTMDIKQMDVTISFPQAEEELRAWLHVSKSAVGAWKAGEGNTSMTIHVEDVKNGEYIETRALLGKGHYAVAAEGETDLTSVYIENEEGRWFESYKRKQTLLLVLTVLDYVIAVIAVAFAVVYVIRLKKKNKPLDLPNKPIYYRDIPDGYTGGEVSPLYFYYSNEKYTDESISATMLELARLRYLSITPDRASKGANITVLKTDEDDSLRSHQKFVLELLLSVRPVGESFTMKELEKYGKNNPTKVIAVLDKYKAAILNKSQRDGAYQKNNVVKEKGKKLAATMVGVGIAGLVLFGFMFGLGLTIAAAGFLAGGIVAFFMSRNAKAPLTLAGQKEFDKLQALSRFMQEFSNMDDHEIPELTLWEDYMIFATAMGIADKVAEQLEIKYPEFKKLSESNFDMDRFVILYFFSRSFTGLSGLNFIGNVANVIRSVEIAERALKAAEMAKKFGSGGGSGFGGGGGFHGGGGGFSGGGFGGRR